MTDQQHRDPEDLEPGDEPMTPRPSQAEGDEAADRDGGEAERAPRPSQAEGERQPE